MGIMDAQLEFATDQAVTATANSENVVDITTARDIGVGESLFLVLLVTETMDDTGDNSTLDVDLVTDDNAALSSATKVRDLVTIPATTVAGTEYVFKLEPGDLAAYERYLGLTFTPANGDLSAGKFSAYLTHDVAKWKAYTSGWSVS